MHVACSTNARISSSSSPGLRLHAGLRKDEVIEARVPWFDLEAGLLHVQKTPSFQPKDRDNRTIPLTDEFSKWLQTSFRQLGSQSPKPLLSAPL